MLADGAIDFESLQTLIESQLGDGVEGFVACGTTGEASTLTAPERDRVIGFVVKQVAGRVPVIAGTGGQSPEATLDAQKRAQAEGADFGLVVTPFYNRPNQAGLLAHMRKVATESSLPFILYNVPSRTGADLKADSVVALAQEPNIIGIKDATGDILRPLQWATEIKKPFAILSGDDASLCPFMWMGGTGVISVVSHLCPRAMRRMLGAVSARDPKAAQAIAHGLIPWCRDLFAEPNPIVVKAALSLLGLCRPALRLPLVPLEEYQMVPLRTLMAGRQALEQTS